MNEKEARAQLRKLIKRGDTVYTCLNKVSRSGMTRHISVHIIKKSQIIDITWLVAGVTGWKLTDDMSLIIHGCGMDMGFHVVYTLNRAIFQRGTDYCGTRDRDAGYATKQAWIN